MPSRRHCLHLGDRSRAIRRASASGGGRRSVAKNAPHFPRRERPNQKPKGPLDAPPLPRADAVVRLGGDVLDAEDLEARRLERADRGLAARARALDEHLDLLEAVLHALAGTRVGRHLRGERGRLAGALEPGRAGRLPGDHVPVFVGQGDDRVVERGLDVRLADGDVLADAAARAAAAGRWTTRRGHLGSRLRRLRLLAAADRLLRALPRARVRLGPLAVHRQAAPVAHASVGADLRQALDRLRALAAQVALDLEVRVDVLAQLRDLLVGQVADLRVRGKAELLADLERGRLADAVDVGQPDLEPLLVREVDPCNTRHGSTTPAFACGEGW